MNERRAMIEARMIHRDEMATRIAKACANFGLTVKASGSTNTIIVENAAGTQYTVTVSHRRRQGAT